MTVILLVPLKMKIHRFYFLAVTATINMFKNYAQGKYQILLNGHLLNVSTLYEYNLKNDAFKTPPKTPMVNFFRYEIHPLVT